MGTWSWKKMAWVGFITMLGLMFTGYATDLLRAALYSLGDSVHAQEIYYFDPSSPGGYFPATYPNEAQTWMQEKQPAAQEVWEQTLRDDPRPISNRSIKVRFSPDETRVEFQFSTPAGHFLARNILWGVWSEELPGLITGLFGRVTLNGRGLLPEDFQPPAWTLDSSADTFEFSVTATTKSQERSWFQLRPAPLARVADADQVIFQFEGYQPDTIRGNPVKASRGEIIFRAENGALDETIAVGAASTTPSIVQQNQPERPSRQSFLQRTGEILDIPFLFGMVKALPLLIFYFYVARRRAELPEMLADLAQVTAGWLLFHVGLYAILTANRWSYQTWLTGVIETNLARWMPWLFGNLPSFGTGVFISVGTVFIGILVPALLLQRAQLLPANRRALPLGIFSMLFFGVILLAAGFGIAQFQALPGVVIMLSLAALAFLATWGGLAFLYRQFGLGLRSAPSVLLAAWTLLALLITNEPLFMGIQYASPELFNADRVFQWQSLGWLIVSTLMGAALLFALLAVAYSMVVKVHPGARLSKTGRFWVIAACLALAVSMRRIFFGQAEWARMEEVIYLAYRLDDLLIYAWQALMVWFLWQAGRQSVQIAPEARLLGLLAGGSMLFSITARWMYIPVTFLLGLAFLAYFLRPAGYWEKIKTFYKPVVKNRLLFLEKIARLNAAERAYQQFHKSLEEKLGKGEMTLSDYQTKSEERRAELDAVNKDAALRNQPLKELALAFGLFETAWQNGLHGAKWALLFASPWITLALVDFLKAPMPVQYFALLGVAVDLLSLLARWLGIGFVFGYFYPYLRGKDGLQKGLWMFLVVALPTLPIAAIYNTSPEQWQATLFWFLQVFLHCSLLGLIAFDFMTVRRGYRNWQMLFEVHGIPVVGVSVTTILAAAGTAIVTLMQGQTTQLVTLALKFILPDLPNLDK